MKQGKKALAIILTLILSISMIPIINVSAAKKVKLNKTKSTIYVGKTVTLKLKNNKNKIKWSSSNKKVATVTKKGKVKGKKVGKAIIIAKVGKKKYRCKITVKKKVTPQSTTKPMEQPTTSRQEETTKNQEQPTTNKTEEPTTNNDDYGDSGEDWIVEGTSNKVWIKEYVGEDTDVVIPAKIQGKNVVGIRDSAFQHNRNITSVTIPGYIKNLPERCFLGCKNLKKIIIQEGVTSIGGFLFGGGAWSEDEGLIVLDTVEIPSSVTSIDTNAFCSCILLKRNFKNKSVFASKIIDDYWGIESFFGADIADKVGNVYISNNVAVGTDENTEEVIIPDGVTTILGGSFNGYYCRNMKTIVIPMTVIDIVNGYYISKDVVFKGEAGSYAETYAKENGYTFIAE